MPLISHALVLPDINFDAWLQAARPYAQAFERVAIVRSPAGNDLNRFRDVTAVQTPQVWMNDDALAHIRRVYPMVVRVDVIPARTPAELQSALQARISASDRYGETRNTPQHIFDRFTLEWPTDARPARITRAFSSTTDRSPDTHEGIDVYAPAGSSIKAAAPGVVTAISPSNNALNYGAYVQITSQLEGQTYIVTYGGLRDIGVQLNQRVLTGAPIAKSAGPAVKLVVQNPAGGLSGLALPNVVDPTLFVYLQGLRLRSTVSALRIRSLPNTDGEVIGTVTPAEVLETKEIHGRTLAKIGVEGQWVSIRRAGVREAYAAGWYLEAYSSEDPVEAIPGVKLPGMNIDLDHRLGRPDPAALKGIGWVRMLYNVSLNPTKPENDPRRYGNTDLDFTFNRYRPFIEQYTRAGIKVILVFTHQTYGEGQGFVWHQMNAGRWRTLTTRFVDVVRRIAAQFAGKNLVYAYQIWNEQDTATEHARAAVPVPPAEYATLLAESIRAIRAADSSVKVITGGHVSGPEQGTAYARSVINALPADARPDGIAFHPYGNGPAGSPFTVHGALETVVRRFDSVLPDEPLWITEWGVLDRQGNDSIAPQVAQYASGFLTILRQQFPGQVACACWYAWADSMDNGYGLVKSNGQPKAGLYESFLRD